MNPIVLVIHVACGALAIVAGFGALIPKKGNSIHVTLGKIFYFSMLGMAGAGSFLAIFSSYETINAFIGLFTLYLVVTGRWTALNSGGTNTLREKVGGAFGIILFVGFVILSIQAWKSGESVVDGIYVEAFYVYTVLSALAMALDLRILLRGGVYGKQRLARHLWRMVLALFIACGSLFLGQPQVFPEFIRESGVLGLPVLLVVIVLSFWLIRIYAGKRISHTLRDT